MSGSTTKTEVGSYFIANYPPFSQWSSDALSEIRQVMDRPPAPVPLGLYLHIPFCRKRCKFCYFRVYIDKNAGDVQRYIGGLAAEIEQVSRLVVIGGRPFRFVYFGGGTPSFLSGRQLESLVKRLEKSIRWDQAEEVTFECEPGTLSEAKIESLKRIGVTRLSLGVENFSDEILQENGRAHLSREIYRAWDWIVKAGFASVNIDLIAGMVGETWENWQQCVERTIALDPASVTIYQMELPYNTVYSRDVAGGAAEPAVADWETKRAWLDHAFRSLEQAGYEISSAYTLVKDPARNRFHYRDHLWQGSDLVAAGVASFGHISGCHYQNLREWDGYLQAVESGSLPLDRAMRPTPRQLLIREMVLQLKRGCLEASYFQRKFAVDILAEWQPVWRRYADEGWLAVRDSRIKLTRQGLLRIDALLPSFFEPEHQGVRYT